MCKHTINLHTQTAMHHIHLDAIYLRPAQHMQGGHELMDLTSGLVITRANVTEIPVTDLVIKAVEKMGYDHSFPTTGLKFTNRQGQIYLDNDWIAGVDYDEYEDEESPEDPEDEENPEDENDDNNGETDYEEEQQELAEILHEPPEDNPNIDYEEEANEQEEDNEEQQESEDNEQQEVEVDNEEQQESEHEEEEPETETEVRRSTRTRKEVDRLNLNIHGILKTKKKVTFMNQDVESKHNLYTQSSPIPHADVEYARDCALLIAKAMVDFYHKGTTNTWSFGQQHKLQKGLKMFKEKGHAAAMKELDQLHKRMCFTPVDINDLTASEKKKAMEAMMLLSEKKDKAVKG